MSQKLSTPPNVAEEGKPQKQSPMAFFAEMMGTFFFLSVILSKGEAFPIAVGLLASIYAFGQLSGGHFNPAVSLMFFAKGDFNNPGALTFCRYVVMQTSGAIFALQFHNACKTG